MGKWINGCLLLAVITLMGISGQKNLPDSFAKCRRKDEKFELCLNKAIDEALRILRNGLPEFGLNSIDPLEVDSLLIEDTGHSAVSLTQKFKKIKLVYLSHSNITQFKTDLPNFRLYAAAYTPKMEFLGNYEMFGRILVVPIQGKGRSNVTMINLTTRHEIIGEPVMRNGELFMRIRKFNVKFDPKRLQLHFSGLFNGDKVLGANVNRFLNENWELVYAEVRGGYEDKFGKVFRQVANRLFAKIPLNRIFLED